MPEEKQLSTKKPPVMFIPGGMLPSQLAFGPLLGILGDQIQPIVKELEVYATPTLPADYGLEMEVEGILKAAEFGRSQAVSPGWIFRWRRLRPGLYGKISGTAQEPRSGRTRLDWQPGLPRRCARLGKS